MNAIGLPSQKRLFLVLTINLLTAALFIIPIQRITFTKIRTMYNHSMHNLSNTFWKKAMITRKKHTRLLPIKLFKNITVINEKECKNKRFLVYKCDSSSLCGGLGDRQRAIVTIFLMALLSNRVFIIDMTHPCKLETFQPTNAYNWSKCNYHLKTISKDETDEYNYIDGKGTGFISEIWQFNFEKKWTKQVTILRMNACAINGIRRHKESERRLNWLLNMANEEVTHRVLHTLFKPSRRILNDTARFYDNNVHGKHLVCCHIRIGKNPSIPSDNYLSSGTPNVTKIFQFLKQFDRRKTHVIYIASDSKDVEQVAKTQLKTCIYLKRTIVHVDRLGQYGASNTIACDGLYTSLLEQYILSTCDTLVLTRSGFSSTAAYFRGRPDGLFLYEPKTHKITRSNLTDIQLVFKHI